MTPLQGLAVIATVKSELCLRDPVTPCKLGFSTVCNEILTMPSGYERIVESPGDTSHGDILRGEYM